MELILKQGLASEGEFQIQGSKFNLKDLPLLQEKFDVFLSHIKTLIPEGTWQNYQVKFSLTQLELPPPPTAKSTAKPTTPTTPRITASTMGKVDPSLEEDVVFGSAFDSGSSLENPDIPFHLDQRVRKRARPTKAKKNNSKTKREKI
jgi:hypothetical protein